MLRFPRIRSPQSVIAEVELLYRTYGYEAFMFYDDELNVSPKMVELMNGLADLKEKLGVDLRFRGFVKAELFARNEIQAQAMRRAGFDELLCGFEGANDFILTNINKKATLADNARAVENAKKHGLRVKALMSIGHPGESDETVRDVEEWLVKMDVEEFDCTIITTYPGSPYYDDALPHQDPGVWTFEHRETKARLHSVDIDFLETDGYYKGIPGQYESFVFTDFLTSAQLVARRDEVERNVRAKLGLPWPTSRQAVKFDHSMGMGLPPNILRQSSNAIG